MTKAGMSFARNRTVLVTGATDGIGKLTALGLVSDGAKVLIHGRNPARLNQTAEWIYRQTGKSVHEKLVADFSSLSQVRRLAAEVALAHDDLQLLINNAGVFSDRHIMTEDGFELTLQVNYLAPFLLTTSLMELLRRNQPSRVINVTSVLHIGASFEQILDQRKTQYDGHAAYGSSKLALSLFTVELAERNLGAGIGICHVHPGGVSTKLLHAGFGPGGLAPEEGAEPVISLATTLNFEENPGRYFSRLNAARPDPRLGDDRMRDLLWTLSERWVATQAPLRFTSRSEALP